MSSQPLTHAPAHVEVLDPIDRWLHVGAMVGIALLLSTGALLHAPPLAQALALNAGALQFWHGGAATLLSVAWILHLARAMLRWR